MASGTRAQCFLRACGLELAADPAAAGLTADAVGATTAAEATDTAATGALAAAAPEAGTAGAGTVLDAADAAAEVGQAMSEALRGAPVGVVA